MKIVVSDNLKEVVLDRLKELGEVVYKPENLNEELKDAEVLVVRSATKVTKEMLESAPNLKAVARAGIGIDNIDCAACKERGVKVINTPGASAVSVAEITIGLIISMLRHISRAHWTMKQKEWAKKHLMGRDMEGKTLGLVGYGQIARVVAKKCKLLGMDVLATDPFVKESDGNARLVDMETLLKEADIFSFHVPMTEETKGMVNNELISKMKDGAYIVNTARGGIIDEDSLYDACNSGKVEAAALDVYPKEPYSGKLLELDNVSFTPHIAGSTLETQERIGNQLVEKLKGLE